MRRLRLWLARWAIGGATDYLWMEVPYRAAFVILPDDLGAWDEERVNTLNAALEEKVGRPASVVIVDRRSTTLLVRVRERLP